MADYVTANDLQVEDAFEYADVTLQAHRRYTENESYQAQLRTRYQRFHFYYQPPWGDQWPEDAALRPNKIHVTINIIAPAVNIDARLQALLPRITLKPDGLGDEQRMKAEGGEKLMLEWLDLSGWDVWMGTLTRGKSIYGKGILKPFWNAKDKRPDVRVVENPANLRIGWGASDFSVMDWALYEYALSQQEASIRFPGLRVTGWANDEKTHLAVDQATDHDDPLGTKVPLGGSAQLSRPVPYQPSDYEQKHVRVWDYWYKKPDKKGNSVVCNAMFVEGTLVLSAGQKDKIVPHTEFPDIPYIVIPQDTEPGNPEGISLVEPLIDLQVELNRAMAHWMQLIADEIDPAWVLEGENADSIRPGMVPKGGQVVAAGSKNTIRALDKSIQVYPIAELIGSIYEQYHKVTGLSPITYGEVPGAQASGRAIAIQVESTANRLDPRRKLLYAGLRELILFWVYMAEKINPKFEVGTDEETGKAIFLGARDVIGGFYRWKFVAPEITPRDVYENTNNEINMVQAKLSSLKTSMDKLGVDSPEEELSLVIQERMNPQLFPGDVQSYVSIFPILMQVQQQMQQMQQQLGQLQGMQQPVPPGGFQAQAEGALNTSQQEAFAAQPQAIAEDQNQPPTGPGGIPAAAGQGPGGPQTSTLIRGGQALNQLAFTSGGNS